MSEYTPTTEHVRFIYSLDGADYVEPDYREHQAQEFDRWLATVEAVAEQRGAIKALREAADHIENEIEFVLPNRHKPLRFRRSYEQDGTGLTPEEWLRARADRLEGDDE